ncbi:MAG: ABC transporter ATP-binding protein, partial [Acidimicrobiales bacterium]
MNAIDVTGLGVRVGGRDLVAAVTLGVEPGTWCTVIGPNGAGKTTLVRAVAGLRRPTTGSVALGGRAVAGLSERERALMVSLVVQHPEVPAGMGSREYVALGRTAHHGLLRGGGPSDDAVVEGVMGRLGLVDLAGRDVATLSGGERQRMVLARALAQATPVMVLDEPTTGLDLRHQVELLELLRKEVADGGLTVL